MSSPRTSSAGAPAGVNETAKGVTPGRHCIDARCIRHARAHPQLQTCADLCVPYLTRKIARLESGTTKNDEGAKFTSCARTLQDLSQRKGVSAIIKCPECPWMFRRRSKRIRDFQGAWEVACKADNPADIDGNPTHIFRYRRRTGVRNVIQAGIPQRIAMMIAGNRSRSVFERYNIVSERDLQGAARRLGNCISQMAGAESRNTSGTLLGTPAKPGRQTGEDKLLITTGVSHCAKVAELADAPDLGSGPARGGGSSPPFRTKLSFQWVGGANDTGCFCRPDIKV